MKVSPLKVEARGRLRIEVKGIVQGVGFRPFVYRLARSCHLDAGMVNPALANLPLDDIDILFIENVGNLICPGGFDLGEYLKVVILSTPEGDDKPHKYPLLFTQANALMVNKTDLMPHVSFNLEAFTRMFKGVNQQAALFPVSGLTGEGITEWGKWVITNLQKLRKS